MSFIRKTASVAVAGAMLLVAAQANAFQINLGGGIGNVNFNTIDWAENGSAYVQGFDRDITGAPIVGDTFSISVISQAAALSLNSVQTASFLDTFAVNTVPNLSTVELTLKATLNETVQSVVGNVANFVLLGGRFDLYLDFTPEANNLISGQGFSDGIRILGGTFAAGQSGSFTDLNLIAPGNAGADGTGSNNLRSVIDFVDSAYITPDPQASNATTTLQYGFSATGWARPTTIDGVALGADTPVDFVMKADANQTLLQVPEPGSIALFGLALCGLGLGRKLKVA
ncbi:MAG: flocculation-associated PEP-CTERM protein PepA [Betaproteobacteria bacterium]|nr:flocculation-associated PEP-CTERM protein PepA [Betaproteobacteria bacterium]